MVLMGFFFQYKAAIDFAFCNAYLLNESGVYYNPSIRKRIVRRMRKLWNYSRIVLKRNRLAGIWPITTTYEMGIMRFAPIGLGRQM